MYQLIGNAPNQIPTNADLGGLAYQDPQYVNITGGNVNVTNFSAANLTIGSTTVTAEHVVTQVADNFSSPNVYISGGYVTGLANLSVTGDAYITGNLTVENITFENREVVTTTETVQGNLIAAAATTSTSTTTGALVVTGGAGIAGNVYAGGLNINASESISVTTVADANFTAPTKFLFSVGNIVAAATTAATSTTTGALVVTGGVGIGNGLYVNGTTYLQNFSTANGHIISSDSAIGINHLNSVSAIGNIYAVAAQVTNFSSGNVLITGGYATGMANVTAGNLYVTNASTIDYAPNSVMPKSYTDAFSIIFGA